MKKQNLLITVLFCLFLGAMLLLTLLLPHRTFSELENRNLEPAPALSGRTVLSGRFMRDAEDWVSDHTVLRDRWVQLKALAERLRGKRENNGVYLAADDTLIPRVEMTDPAQVEKNLEALRSFPAKLSVPVCFGLIPTAASVWSDRLPAGAPTLDEAACIGQLYADSGCETIDLAGALNAHRGEPVFYRTDHHWTSRGARWAADAIFASMGLPPLREEELSEQTVSDSFRGTAFSSSGAWWVRPDEITTMVPGDGVEVVSNFTGTEEAGSLYVPSWLEKKNQYAFFLGGNQPVCVVRTQAQGPKLLLIRDSYADSLTPFLTLRFSEIHLLDLRYYRLPAAEYAQAHGVDRVLVLYGLSSFLDDRNIIQLKR